MEKINIKQGAFGFGYKFIGIPDEWSVAEANVWFSAWDPGNPAEIICQKACELSHGYYWLNIVKGDFDANPGVYHYEIARYEEDTMLDPSFTGELEILESAGAPGGDDE